VGDQMTDRVQDKYYTIFVNVTVVRPDDKYHTLPTTRHVSPTVTNLNSKNVMRMHRLGLLVAWAPIEQSNKTTPISGRDRPRTVGYHSPLYQNGARETK